MPDLSPAIATPVSKAWFVYLVRAANGALYCGISDDPHKRFAKHQSGKGARFFHSSPAQALVYIEACAAKGDALAPRARDQGAEPRPPRKRWSHAGCYRRG